MSRSKRVKVRGSSASHGKDGLSAVSEYSAYARMGFISLEEVDMSESTEAVSFDQTKTESCRSMEKLEPVCSLKSVKSWDDLRSQGADKWMDVVDERLDPLLIESLLAAGYHTPTAIQEHVLQRLLWADGGSSSKAIEGIVHADLLASAPTGSGKTLAFLLPILHSLLHQLQASSATDACLDDSATPNDHEAIRDGDQTLAVEDKTEDAKGQGGDGLLQDGEWTMLETVPLKTAVDQQIRKSSKRGRLHSLIVVPTRELAMQINDHLNKLLAAGDLKGIIHAVVLVGGLSQERQERLLQYGPQIVIATPGRLCELISTDEKFKEKLERQLRFVVFDEADRLVQKGHFQDLDSLMHLLGRTRKSNFRRQTMLFSATLANVSLNKLCKRIHVNRNHSLIKVDLTSATAANEESPKTASINPVELVQFRLDCSSVEEKDLALVSVLQDQLESHESHCRVLVFVNAIDSIRVLSETLCNVLIPSSSAAGGNRQSVDVQVLTLHANMQQRQRIRSLERFSNNTTSRLSVLVTSDVAARGLDISNVSLVIHYHVARGRDVFLHRSGRTARGKQHGRSLSLVCESEISLFNKVTAAGSACIQEWTNANRPLVVVMDQWRKAVQLAAELAKKQSMQVREKRSKCWEERAAEILGVQVSDDDDDRDGDNRSLLRKQQEAQIKSLRQQLLMELENK